MKKSLFRPGFKYFHINVDFKVHPIFKDLDWVFVQKVVNEGLSTFQIQLHALVMMDTHVHLLVQSSNLKENYFCEHLKTKLKREDPLDSHCEPLGGYPQYINAYKYIYRNPVEAGLCPQVEDYSYSTLRSLLGFTHSYCEISDNIGLIHNPLHHLNWLNNLQEFKFSKLSQFDFNENAKTLPH